MKKIDIFLLKLPFEFISENPFEMSSTSKPTEAEPSKTSKPSEAEPSKTSPNGPGIIFQLLTLLAAAFGRFTEDEMSSITPTFPFNLDQAGPHLTSVAFNGNQFGFFTLLQSDKKFKESVSLRLKEPNAMLFLYARHVMEMDLDLPPSLTEAVTYEVFTKGVKSTKTVDSIDKMVASNITNFKSYLAEGHENYQGLIRDFISTPHAVRKQWNSPNNEKSVADIVQRILPEGYSILRNLILSGVCVKGMTGEFDIAVLYENKVIAIIECKKTLGADEIPKQSLGIAGAKTRGLSLKSGEHVLVSDDVVSVFIAEKLSSNTAHFRNATLSVFKNPNNATSFSISIGFLAVRSNVAEFASGINSAYANSTILKLI